MSLNIETIPALSDNYIYVVSNQGKEAFVVDPSVAEPVLNYLKGSQLNLNAILNTHHHWDHTGGNLEIQKETGCEIYGSYEDRERIPGVTQTYRDGDRFQLLGEKIDVISAEGHTLGHILFYLRNLKALFSGDTLFSLGCGRLFEGSAESMWNTLLRIRELPKDTQVYFGHEYTLKNSYFQKTIERDNPQLDDYMAEVQRKLNQNQPTTPTCLETEALLNLFMRADERKIQKILGVGDAVNAFAKLRKLKDKY